MLIAKDVCSVFLLSNLYIVLEQKLPRFNIDLITHGLLFTILMFGMF